MEKNKNIPNDKDKKKNNSWMPNKNILIVLCLSLLFFLLFGNKLTTITERKVDYNTFIELVEDKKVESANVNSSSGKVTYKLADDPTTYYTNYPYTEDFVEVLLVNDVDVEIHETSWFIYFLRYGMTPLMIIVLFFFIFNMNRIGGNEMAVEPNNTVKTRFKDIAGMDEIKEDLLVLSDMMKNPEYRKSGARIPRGILLQGPPGNGKTMLARAFAGETGVNFIAVNACDFGSQFVGIGSSKIKKVFTTAKKNAPCVIFIDEIDSVGSKRGTASDAAGKEMNTMLTALLNQMDGFQPMDNVMVLAATNRASDLDEALVRPGRFDRQFIVDYPDRNARIELFKLYTKGKKMASDVDFERLATKTFGYSCSKIECIVNEAIILSIKDKNEVVKMENFEDAILQMDIKGHVKKHYSQTDEERKTVAYHEAGHAVIAYIATEEEVSSITIRPTTSGAGGFTLTENKDDSGLRPIQDYKNRLIMLYGGRAAEVKLRGSIEGATAGASADIKEATRIATSYVSIQKGIDYSAFGELGVKQVLALTETLLQDVWSQSQKIIKENWGLVDAVAKELMETETVSKERFLEIANEQQGIYPAETPIME